MTAKLQSFDSDSVSPLRCVVGRRKHLCAVRHVDQECKRDGKLFGRADEIVEHILKRYA